MEVLAAREVRRYFYVRTGTLLSIETGDRLPAGDTIVVARQDRAVAAGAGKPELGREEHFLKSNGRAAWIVGGDDAGTLYGAYRFAEKLGVRFYLHGDVVPDVRIDAAVPQFEETGRPLFSIRGIQPFHDFPEGPDWWNQDDYLAFIAQLPKMRMNFIGLHNYPEGGVGPEPGVWIGQPADADSSGKVRFSYPAQWANTERDGTWGYAAMNTSDFIGGASLLFEKDHYGSELPKTPEECNRLFDHTGAMLHAAFSAAKSLGVKTCIGTETPLRIPKLVQERLAAQGKDPKDPAVVRALYEGMFRRIAALYRVDYYWLWTPEDWTWGGDKQGQFEATTQDIQAALDALSAIGKPFTLVTSGWVLGPQNDRAALDRFLPKECPMSTINRQVGHAPDEPGFASIEGRPKWVIPWLENDPDLTAPQPWAGRMRYDAADARRLGCTGLLGIHWRTKILAPNLSALAAAGWDQGWVPADFESRPTVQIPATLTGANQHDNPQRGRTMPVEDFYVDFARASFGDRVAEPAGRILESIDGVNLPEPATWLGGPGGIKAEKTPWTEVKVRYQFVDDLAALRNKVQGAGNLERFDYWLNTYRYMATLAHAGCLRGQLDQAAAAIKREKDPAKQKELAVKALPGRIELARVWEQMVSLQVAATDTPGELGTLANLEQHNRKKLKFLEIDDELLAKALGTALPDTVELSRGYAGPARIIVPTVRTLATKGEAVALKLIALDNRPARSVSLYWRPLGTGTFHEVNAGHLNRAVYSVTLPALNADVEYYIQTVTADGKKLVWPATAPTLNQTVIAR